MARIRDNELEIVKLRNRVNELEKETKQQQKQIKRIKWAEVYKPRRKPSRKQTSKEILQSVVFMERLIKQCSGY